MRKRPSLTPESVSPFICDAHIDTLSKMLRFGWDNLGEIPRDSHVTPRRLRQGGVGAAVFAIFTDKYERSLLPLNRALKMIDIAYSVAGQNSDWLELVTDSRGLTRAREKGKLSMILSIENGIVIGNDLLNLRTFHRLGVRLMSLTWNFRNQLGDGVGRGNSRRGLAPFGREALREMERLGIIVDVSHLNERTFWHVVEATGSPVVATHSNAFSICRHPRNLTDPQIRAIAYRNGFVGLNFCNAFLSDSDKASIHDVVKHACHIAEVGGIKTVAIGSDFDGIVTGPVGLEHIGKMTKLIAALRKAGFSQADVEAISHKNILRVFRAVCG